MNEVLSFSNPGHLVETVVVIFISFFFATLFIQSSFDKIMNFDSNLDFVKTHFQKTVFHSHITLIFITLTCLELITGLLFFSSLFILCFWGISNLLINLFLLGLIMANVTLCCLFLGQRIAQDYVGAANLTIYFLVALLSFLFFL